ncbi:MAG: methionyl-tRNA formyltransferase [Candidatus Acidiferrales bacterium]
MPLRIVFCGTPAFAFPSLRYLNAQSDIQIVGVVTQPDRPRGRGQEMAVSAVKAAALERKVNVYQPEKIKSDEAFHYFQRLAPDAVVIIAYGQIISQRLIDMPRLGWINLHASLLPKYRGAAPINWAIVNGETRTGLTTMRIDAGLDTGAMLLHYETEIGLDEAAPELTSRLAEVGAPLVAETLRKLDRGDIKPVPQDEAEATFAPPLKKEGGRIDWSLSAQQIYNRIRGLDPWPGTFTTFRGKTCRIWGRPTAQASSETAAPDARAQSCGAIFDLAGDAFVACGDATLFRVEFVQLEGRKRVTAREFANGARLRPSDHFGE